MELCETQRFIIGLVVTIVLGGATIGLLIREGIRANNARAPLLKPFGFGIQNLRNFAFRVKNYGQTEAKDIEASYELENLGEIEIPEPERALFILPEKTTLAPQEEMTVSCHWMREDDIISRFSGIIKITLTYTSDFIKKPLSLKYHVFLKEGSYPSG